MYWELARLRQSMNQVAHVEPTGTEVFPADGGAPAVAGVSTTALPNA
jgi:hypothetical protein